MARSSKSPGTSQIGGFVTSAPAARPVVLSGSGGSSPGVLNGAGPRVTSTTPGKREPVIQGAKRATATKRGK